ncbi:translocation/assembly module TamB domain-containing protein [Legionella hackeliae]|uniref:translocation/assembly module TamB domain-containing protein n=1 Tax=Legionella hackeliae TaxID=449 RepID=UPI001E551A22|nr:translocation/assembly module TamB domain-containing protein [Legionella hackeliae]
MLFLITTTPGLSLTFKLANYFLPGNLKIEHVQGYLSNCTVGYLNYQDSEIDITLKNVNLKWRIFEFLQHKLDIQTLTSEQAQVAIHTQKTENHPRTFAFPQLPFAISLQNVFIGKAQFIHAKTNHEVKNFKLRAQFTNKQWQITQLKLDFLGLNVEGNWTNQVMMPYALKAEFKLKNTFKNQPVEGVIKMGGDFSLYHWEGELKNPALASTIHNFSASGNYPLNPTDKPQSKGLKPLIMTLHGTFINGQELNTQAQWENFIWPFDKQPLVQSSSGQIKIAGHVPELNIELDSTLDAPVQSEIVLHARTSAKGINATGKAKMAQGNINFNLNYDESINPRIKGNVQAISILSDSADYAIKDFNLNADFKGDSLINLTLNSHLTARYFNTPLQASLLYKNQHLQGQIHLDTNRLEVDGNYPYQWDAKAILPKPQLLSPSLAGLDTTIVVNASMSNFMTGQMHLTIQPGHYRFDEETTSNLQFLGGQINANLTPKKLVLNGKLTIDKDKNLTMAFQLPNLQFERNGLTKQAIAGNLQLNVNSLSFLQNLSSEISKSEGQLNAVLKASGTLTKPFIEGKINLKKGQLSLPNFGLDFHTIQMNLQSQNQHWKTEGSLITNNTQLTMHGQGTFDPRITGAIHLDGDDLTLINTPEYLVNISPKLTLELTPNALTVKGTVVIPKAQIKPQSFTNSVSLSEDVVFEGNEKSANPLHINTDVRLEMGDDVSLSVKGLKGFLTGAIHLHQLPQEPLNATGELAIKDGKYQAYGQDLTIEQGQLIFTRGSGLNPGIQVRAIRRVKNTGSMFSGSNQLLDFNPSNLQNTNFGRKTTVGIDVTGRLTSPKIELFSIPSTLSQADILSMILLDRPVSQANKAGGQLLLAAMSSMNLGSGANGTQLVEQLKQTLGVDVNVESNQQFDVKSNQMTEKTSVVVGKSLSKRLYVSYNYGLAKTDSNVVTLTYLLNKFFSLQVNSSLTGSGIDLLYTHRKE